jgi:hypothetical protein
VVDLAGALQERIGPVRQAARRAVCKRCMSKLATLMEQRME